MHQVTIYALSVVQSSNQQVRLCMFLYQLRDNVCSGLPDTGQAKVPEAVIQSLHLGPDVC